MREFKCTKSTFKMKQRAAKHEVILPVSRTGDSLKTENVHATEQQVCRSTKNSLPLLSS